MWSELEWVVNESDALTTEGRAAAQWALNSFKALITAEALQNGLRRYGELPIPLAFIASHPAALVRVLTMAARLELFREERSFAPVREGLKTDLSPDFWIHTQLQMEMARAAIALDAMVSFEPLVASTGNRGDLLFETEGVTRVVETTTVFPPASVLALERAQDDLCRRISQAASRCGVYATVEVIKVPTSELTKRLIARIESVVTWVKRTKLSAIVEDELAMVTVTSERPPVGQTSFAGLADERDGVARLISRLRKKARQSSGGHPTWLRVDVRDGLWQFTPWAQAPLETKLGQLRDRIVVELQDMPHVEGLVVSSGVVTGIDSSSSNSISIEGSVAQRHCINAYQGREILIIPLAVVGLTTARRLSVAYSSEHSWLDHDLVHSGIAPVASLWSNQPGSALRGR